MRKNLFVKIILLALCIFAISCKENVPNDHVHSAGETVIENIIEATSTSMGSYEEVVYCSTCGEELSRIKKETDEHTHIAGEPVKENIVEATLISTGSYEEVTYCTICDKEMSRKTIKTDKIAHEHIASDIVKEDIISPDPFNTSSYGSYDEVTYCTICNDELSREHIDNYFYQFDYLELSSTVNNLDNLIDIGNGKHLLNAKTNNGKNVRIIIDG